MSQHQNIVRFPLVILIYVFNKHVSFSSNLAQQFGYDGNPRFCICYTGRRLYDVCFTSMNSLWSLQYVPLVYSLMFAVPSRCWTLFSDKSGAVLVIGVHASSVPSIDPHKSSNSNRTLFLFLVFGAVPCYPGTSLENIRPPKVALKFTRLNLDSRL